MDESTIRSGTVTVGIPTFNRADWLCDTVHSVLAQTFTDFRVIISDNASADDTPRIVRSLRDDRIDYVRSERNIGAIANINRLISLTDTEFLVLLPDDDLLHPEHLASSLEALRSYERSGLVHSAFEQIDADSHLIKTGYPIKTSSAVTVEPGKRALERMMSTDWPICFSSVMYRTQAIRQAGGPREDAGPFCDLQLWMRIALEWDLAYISAPLVKFRVHDGSVSSTLGGQAESRIAESELLRRHSQMSYQQRTSFLEAAPLEPRRVSKLRALAAFTLLKENVRSGLSRGEEVRRLLGLIRTSPSVLLMGSFWRFVFAELGGRRTHLVIRWLLALRLPKLVTASPVHETKRS
jgi:hypothetical protein